MIGSHDTVNRDKHRRRSGIITGRKEAMRDYRQYIQDMKDKWIGQTVSYEGEQYKVVDVDYNGCLLLNKKARFTDTTAVDVYMLDLEAVEG